MNLVISRIGVCLAATARFHAVSGVAFEFSPRVCLAAKNAVFKRVCNSEQNPDFPLWDNAGT
jgi:hypothetical protein